MSKRLRHAGITHGGALRVGELRLVQSQGAHQALRGGRTHRQHAVVHLARADPGAGQRCRDGLREQLRHPLIAHPALFQRVVEGFPVHAVVVDEIRRHVRAWR